MAHFQHDFILAEVDDRLTATTESSGYYGPSVDKVYIQAPQNKKIKVPDFVATVAAKFSQMMDNMTITPANINSKGIFNLPGNISNYKSEQDENGNFYCQTHVIKNNKKHTIMGCRNPGKNHNKEATIKNCMGDKNIHWVHNRADGTDNEIHEYTV